MPVAEKEKLVLVKLVRKVNGLLFGIRIDFCGYH